MNINQKELLKQFKEIVGQSRVLTKASDTLPYRKGFRFGSGEALAVVFPKTILEQWRVIKVCVASNCIIITQAANTGLTGGSTPNGFKYDRDVIIINTLHIKSIHLINNGEQVVSLSGTKLHDLECVLEKKNRTPHSVIGSSQIGATVVGGIANNSGGALVKRGPAYTEFALYAQVDKRGNVQLVNHLGISDLGDSPEEVLTNVQIGNFNKKNINLDHGMASDRDYANWIRDIDSKVPARFNADSRRLFEASGCAGKIAVFAVITDTFPKLKNNQTFYLGTNDVNKLSDLRKYVLRNFSELPDMAEYFHRDIFNITEKYGKSIFIPIFFLGTKKIPELYKIKYRIEKILKFLPMLPSNFLDVILFYLGKVFPKHLPSRLLEYRDKYEHHLIISTSGLASKEIREYLKSYWGDGCDFFCCTKEEKKKILIHRFAAGGAIGAYHSIHKKHLGDILALDIALRRNDFDWSEELPVELKENINLSLYYGHFLCNVFHRNYILKQGADKDLIKSKMLNLLDKKGAKYPAEHNVGHEYHAQKELRDFYIRLDPTNTFNPGIGRTDKHAVNCNCCF